MPTPRSDETEAEFVKRCVPLVIADETAEDGTQANAICHSMWDQAQETEEKSMDQNIQRGLYLVQPHGKYTVEGKKRAVAKAEPLELQGKHILVSKDKALGIVDLAAPESVGIKEFDERFDEHRVTRNERRRWWDGKDKLYLYEIKEFEEFDPPREVVTPNGVKSTIHKVQFKDEKTANVLDMLQSRIHKAFTTTADDLYGLGFMDTEERIKLSAAIGSALGEFTQQIDDLDLSGLQSKEVDEIARGLIMKARKNGGLSMSDIKNVLGEKVAHGAQSLEELQNEIQSAFQFSDVVEALQKADEDGSHDYAWIAATYPHLNYLVSQWKGEFYQVNFIKTDGDYIFSSFTDWIPLEKIEEWIVKVKELKLQAQIDALEQKKREEKVGRRIRGDKVDILKKIQTGFNDVVETIKDLISFADYDDKEPHVLFEKQKDTPRWGIKTLELKDGRTGLLTWTTNAFKDLEGEIFSTEAIQDLVERYSDKEVKGEYKFWHIPGSKFGDILWQGVSGRFLAEVGVFDDTEVGNAFKDVFLEFPDGHPEVAPEGWGTSHGFMYKSDDREDGVYEWFDKEETSVLPGSAAANPYNPKMEVLQMDAKQKTALSKLAGDKIVDLIETTGEEETKRLEELGVENKSKSETKAAESGGKKKEKTKIVGEPAVEKVVEDPKSEPKSSGGPKDVKDEGAKEEGGDEVPLTFGDVKPAFEGFAEALTAINVRLDEVDASLKTLAESDDAKIKTKVELTPKESLKSIADSVIGKKETQVDGRTTLAKDGPKEAEPNVESRTGISLIDNLKARNLEKVSGSILTSN